MDMLDTSDRFQPDLVQADFTHLHTILMHMTRRPDIELLCPNVLDIIAHAPNIHPKHLYEFHTLFSGLGRLVFQFNTLEAACRQSGFYESDRAVVLEKIRGVIAHFEQDDNWDVLQKLRQMMIPAR